MSFYALVFVSIAVLLILLLSWWLIPRKKNIPVLLFSAALQNENSGHFEAAVVSYETALEEVKKTRFHKQLKDKIIKKLRLLHTVIEYKKGLGYTR